MKSRDTRINFSADAALHTRGESHFIDDAPLAEGLLYAAVLTSPEAHGKIKNLGTKEAQKVPGVRGLFTSEDIPGENQIGVIIPDEPLLAEDTVDYVGQPLALVVADSEEAAGKAVRAIQLEIEELPPVFDPRKAFDKGFLIVPPRIFSSGDVDSAWEECDVIVEGRAESGPQEHLYLETQGAHAFPLEDGGVKIISATQSPTGVQRAAARVLGLSLHKVEVEVLRLGGAFGGKEEQAVPWAAMAALGAFMSKKPVKLVLHRHEDMCLTGKRHPYSSDFKIGLKNNGEIIAYEITFFQNAGASADLSPSILGRTLFHTTGSYYIPNVRATGISCRTNLPPNTACRGFGGPQAMFVMEAAIFKAARALDVEPAVIQKKNLLKEGDQFHYGMRAHNCQALRCWEAVEKRYDCEKTRKRVEEFNAANPLIKKGLYFMPVCFGISFTNKTLNQAGALVHIYTDGSVSVSTGAVEMGQGVKVKIIQVASRVFSIPAHRIRIESTNTSKVANTSPTAASTGADLNGKAAELACRAIYMRLKKEAADELGKENPDEIEIRDEAVYYQGERTDITWNKLIQSMYQNRINLSAQAHYATPGLNFDKGREKGEPFAYHVFGTAITEVSLDCLRGTYEIDSVQVVHDGGTVLNELIDRGQAEGGIVQGIGWLTVEELLYSEDGRLLTESLSSYKVPDIYFAPEKIEVYFLPDSVNPMGIFNSKAIGEPPFMYGIGSYYALLSAMGAFRPERDFEISAPLTPEKVLLSLYG